MRCLLSLTIPPVFSGLLLVLLCGLLLPGGMEVGGSPRRPQRGRRLNSSQSGGPGRKSKGQGGLDQPLPDALGGRAVASGGRLQAGAVRRKH